MNSGLKWRQPASRRAVHHPSARSESPAAEILPPEGKVAQGSPPDRAFRANFEYWIGLPFRWAYQMAHNGLGIFRVLDIIRFRPLPPGLVGEDHPWVTGLNPQTGKPIWSQNVIYRSARPSEGNFPSDLDIIDQTGRFLAKRVALSAQVPEIPQGPVRRMPHGINYIHGSSHYNSGILIFTDFIEALKHFSYRPFREELWRFVHREKREVLILFRQKNYKPWDIALFSCALRTFFPWFCNANGPKDPVLWGNHAPYPATNLITGRWADDVYALKRPNGKKLVARSPISRGAYFQNGPYGFGRDWYSLPERCLTWVTYWRVRLRGARGGMFFVDRRKVYADQIETRARLGLPDVPIAKI